MITARLQGLAARGGIEPLVEGAPQHVKTLIDPWVDAARPSDTVSRRDQKQIGEEK